jgi:hypothetical protein
VKRPKGLTPTPVLERIVRRITLELHPDPRFGHCWIWPGSHNMRGYGQIGIGSISNGTAGKGYVHRLAYQLIVGPIPDGLVLDHLCRRHPCCNPEHLEPVTELENIRRGDAGKAWRAIQIAKTHCPQGHPYSGTNVRYRPAGGRECRTCRTQESRTRRAKLKQGSRPAASAAS